MTEVLVVHPTQMREAPFLLSRTGVEEGPYPETASRDARNSLDLATMTSSRLRVSACLASAAAFASAFNL